MFFVVINSVGIFLNRVPFIDHNYASTSIFWNSPRQFLILFGHAIQGVNHQQDNIGTPNRFEGSKNAKKFWSVFNILLFTDACGINQSVALPSSLHHHIDRITGGSGNGTDDRALFSHKRIEQTRLAHIGTPNDRHFDFVYFFNSFCSWKMLNEFIQQFTRSITMNARNRKRLT